MIFLRIKKSVLLFFVLFRLSNLYANEIIEIERFEELIYELYVEIFSPNDYFESFIINSIDNNSLKSEKQNLLESMDDKLNEPLVDSPQIVEWTNELSMILISLSTISEGEAGGRYLGVLDYFYNSNNFIREELITRFLFVELFSYYTRMKDWNFTEYRNFSEYYLEKIDNRIIQYDESYLTTFNLYYNELKKLIKID